MGAIIHVDMDQTLFDFEGHFLGIWRERFPDRPFVPLSQRTTIRIKDQYNQCQQYWDDIEEIFQEPGFYETMPLLPGAQEALESIMRKYPNAYILSRPSVNNKTCASEKISVVKKNWDEFVARKVILAANKALVKGDVLIDDVPYKGILQNDWSQILYNTPYNQDSLLPRLTWTENWEEVIENTLHSRKSWKKYFS